MTDIPLLLRSDGSVFSVYDDKLARFYARVGDNVRVIRISDVEYNERGQQWEATLRGDTIPIASGAIRQDVIKHEVKHLNRNLLDASERHDNLLTCHA